MSTNYKSLAIKAGSVALYEAFAKELQEMGWKFHKKFNDLDFFTIDPGRLTRHDSCLFLSNGQWSFSDEPLNTPQFAPSCTAGDIHYNLDSEYAAALKAAKALFDEIKELDTVYELKLNNSYTAKVYVDRVEVGCQKFDLSKIIELGELAQKQKRVS